MNCYDPDLDQRIRACHLAESVFRSLIRLRWLIIVLVLSCTVVAWLQMGKLRFETDLEAMIPFDDPVQAYSDVVEDRFGIRDLIIIGVLNNNPDENGVFNPRTLGIVKELSEQIALIPGIQAIRDEDVASVATMDNITGTADGMAVDPFMEEVPHAAEDLATLKTNLFANSMFVNWLVSKDGTGLLISAKMESSGGTLEGVTRRAAVYNAIRVMVQVKRDSGVPEKFYIAGRGALEVTIGEYANQDMARFMPLVLLVILGTLFFTYRSIRGVLLPVAVVIVSVIWTIGLMATAEVPMMHITSIMPVVLMAVGVADGIHILSCYYDKILAHPKHSSTEVVVAAMVEMWKPVVLTSLTTAAGFLSFLTAPMPPVQHFGLFCSFGVLAAMVFSLTLFPAVLSILPAKMSKLSRMSRGLGSQTGRSDALVPTGWAARTLAVVGGSVARHHQLILLLGLVITGVCLVGTRYILVSEAPITHFHTDAPIRVADRILRETFQGTMPLYVAIEGHTPDLLKDPGLLAKLDQMQATVEQDPVVGGSVSLAEYVKRMHRIMNEDRPEMEVIPTDRDLVAQYLLLYSFSGDPDDFDEVVDYDYQHANVSFFLRSDNTEDVYRVVQRVQDFAVEQFGLAESAERREELLTLRLGRWLTGARSTIVNWETQSGFRIGFAGSGYFINRLTELVISGQATSLVTSLGAVFILTALMFRSVTAGLINIIPIGMVIIFSFGVQGLVQSPLDLGKSLTAAMVIGVGIDYTIHLLNKYRNIVRAGLTDPEAITLETMATSGKAIFISATVVIGGFLVFLASNFLPNYELGVMMALNLGACLVVSVTVLPAVLNTFKPRFVYGDKEAPLGASKESEH